MNTLTDKSNLEIIITTLRWGDVMLAALAEKTDAPVVLKRVYVRDDEIVFAFTYRKNKYSLTVPITRNIYDCKMTVRSAKNSYIELETDYQNFIYGNTAIDETTLTNKPLFN